MPHMTEYTIKLRPCDVRRLAKLTYRDPDKLMSHPKQAESALRSYLKSEVDRQVDVVEQLVDGMLDPFDKLW